jgi:hypothetical protein
VEEFVYGKVWDVDTVTECVRVYDVDSVFVRVIDDIKVLDIVKDCEDADDEGDTEIECERV